MKRWMRLLAVVGLVATLVGAVPVGAENPYFYSTWARVQYPPQYSDETVGVRLCWNIDCSQPGVGVRVHTVWHYRTADSYADGMTGSDGIAWLTRSISDATCGFTVQVDIFVGDDQSQLYGTSFTPCGSASAPSYSSAPSYTQPTYSQPSYGGPVSGSGGVCPAGYPIKANDNSGIYHVPGGQFYDVTNARNCFATEQDAINAGYRASYR